MRTQDACSAAAQHYAEAYTTHYAEHNLFGALRAYDLVIDLHPGTPEAEYARAQIRNIVDLVVPAGELLTAQIELSLHHLQPDGEVPKLDPARGSREAVRTSSIRLLEKLIDRPLRRWGSP